jgi:hypothetical protein
MWVRLFRITLQPPVTQQICAQGKSESPDLFGSSVIDFLECLLDCEKNITVKIDSGGWCFIKGKYKVNGTDMYTLPNNHPRRKPLNVCEQKELYEWLYNFSIMSNNHYLWRLRRCEEFDIDFNDDLFDLDLGEWNDDRFYRTLHGPSYGKVHLTFKVDLKCRKELAPVELLLELLKEDPCEDNEDESAHGTQTTLDPGPDLELKLTIRKTGSWLTRSVIYKCLIQQRHTDS